MSIRTLGMGTFLSAVLVLAWAPQTLADDAADAQKIVDQSVIAFGHFVADPKMKWFKANARNAKALMVVPKQVKGGFVIGASGGKGVLLVRNDSGGWSSPSFYNMGAASIGLQIGGEISEVLLMFMTDKGVRQVLNGKIQLGADAKIAAGPLGTGAQAATADVYSFARSKGAFAGVSAEGSVLDPNEELNTGYYQGSVTPDDIARGQVSNPGAEELVAAITAAAS